MILPIEILDVIIRNNSTSFKTLISWSQIFDTYKDIISKEVGLLILNDMSFSNNETPLNYNVLLNKTNNMTLNPNEQIDSVDLNLRLLEFLSEFNNLLIIIKSDNSYNENLTTLLSKVVRFANNNTNICVIYKNFSNFMSKLYLNEFKKNKQNLLLSELHIFGSCAKDSLYDIDTFFETTYLYNIKDIYSLDIQGKDHQIFANELESVKQINYSQTAPNLASFFSNCPKLSHLGTTKFPANYHLNVYTLPCCNSLELTDHHLNVKYPIINGVFVKEKLILSPGLRSVNSNYKNLYFPNIEKLVINYNEITNTDVNFSNCDFSNLKTLDCGTALVQWSDLRFTHADLNTLRLKIYDISQLKWLMDCPYQLNSITFQTPNYTQNIWANMEYFLENNPDFKFDIKAKEIKLDVKSIDQCSILENLILPLLNESSSLHLNINEEKLIESYVTSKYPVQENYNISVDECNNNIIFNLPKLNNLTVIYKERPNHLTRRSSTSFNASQHMSYPSYFMDVPLASEQKLSVSPSQFRKNSLAGLDSVNARRLSIISIESPLSSKEEDRRSSIGNVSLLSGTGYPIEESFTQEYTLMFYIENQSLDTLTTNLAALESCVFSFGNTFNKSISLLIIELSPEFGEYSTDSELSTWLSSEVVDLLKYPYNLNLPIHINKLQFKIDLSGLSLAATAYSRLCKSLQAILFEEGHKLTFVNDYRNNILYLSVP